MSDPQLPPTAPGGEGAAALGPAAAPGVALIEAPMRSPWQLKLAGWVWIASGLVFALGPALAVVLLEAQYRSLRRQVFGAAGIADRFDSEDLLQIEHYLTEFERFEATVLEASGWVLGILLVVYACFALVSFGSYALLARRTALGDNWARILSTVLACLSTPLIFLVWELFAALSWLPIGALWANHLGLVLIALHTAGVVFSWLPASNAYVRQRRAARLAYRQPIVPPATGFGGDAEQRG